MQNQQSMTQVAQSLTPNQPAAHKTILQILKKMLSLKKTSNSTIVSVKPQAQMLDCPPWFQNFAELRKKVIQQEINLANGKKNKKKSKKSNFTFNLI